ncbi:MAG: hypothetical protein GY805_10810, partial [Chloroflexi bacterium]|nr:hypothetical protein [Chloroflexota bacterium]
MTNTLPTKKIGIFAIATGLIMGAGYPLFKAQIIELAARLLSSDNSISQQGAAELAAAFYFFVVMLIIAGWVLIKADNTVWRTQFRQAILTDPLGASPTPSPAFMLALSLAAGVFLIIHINLYDPTSALFDALYLEDGLFEWITVILMLVSSLLLGRTIFTLRKKASNETIYRLTMGIYLLFMVAFFIYAMEEISWGQRIFGWETPPVLAEKNIQNETNIHN